MRAILLVNHATEHLYQKFIRQQMLQVKYWIPYWLTVLAALYTKYYMTNGATRIS